MAALPDASVHAKFMETLRRSTGQPCLDVQQAQRVQSRTAVGKNAVIKRVRAPSIWARGGREQHGATYACRQLVWSFYFTSMPSCNAPVKKTMDTASPKR